jgi:hypothetical protein
MHRSNIAILAGVTLIATTIFTLYYYSDFMRSQQCDTPGSPCCTKDAEVKTSHCHKGLGCDLTTNQCTACGAPGQPCCDGHFTGFSMKGYTGFLLDSAERIESCDGSARCDARLAPDGTSWLGSRTCQTCGTKDGGPCCGPDVRYALGRCFLDGQTNEPLTCNDPWAGERGTCIRCGRWNGDIACMSGQPCVDGLVEKDGLCVSCGYPGQPLCDRGEPCRGGQSVPNKSYSLCVAAGGAWQPCLPNGGCGYQRMFCNAQKICEPCGGGGETCCPAAQGNPCTVGECRDGRCFACGYMNMPECTTGERCRDGSEPVNGWCRPCGNEGQRCCFGMSIRCYDGMRCRDGTCQRPAGSGGGGGPQPKTCSGQPYTWSTILRPVWIEDANGCVAYVNYLASTPEEALQCARGQYGEAAFGTTVSDFHVAVTCPNTGCNQRTYPAKDQEGAQNCAEATSPGCEVEAGLCP